MTANERHNKRDEIISLKHRGWGFNVPAVDIDFLMIEYDQSIPKALIEYRHLNGSVRVDASIKALIALGDMAKLPFFVVQYYYDTDNGKLWKPATVDTPAHFRIIPMNQHAEPHANSADWLNEDEYRKWLHQIRGRNI